MSVECLVIGDPHFQTTNLIEVDIFIDKILEILESQIIDFIVVLGDVLHTHEKVHTTALNKAYEFVEKISKYAKTYILVGNHDYENNQQFLTTNHWMNGMKKWNNVYIVDKVIYDEINEYNFIFVPYVFPGRFFEALDTIDFKKEDVSCIFAHQEFASCKMGAFISIEGDKYPLDYPNVVSGHIHLNQTPQENIYYPGSCLEHTYSGSDNSKSIVAILTFYNKKEKYQLEEINLDLPNKKVIYLENIEEVKNLNISELKKSEHDKIKVSISGNFDEFKHFKKSKMYKELMEEDIKIVFHPKRIETKIKNEQIQESLLKYNDDENVHFTTILKDLIDKERNPYLTQIYEYVFNEKNIKVEDILFL